MVVAFVEGLSAKSLSTGVIDKNFWAFYANINDFWPIDLSPPSFVDKALKRKAKLIANRKQLNVKFKSNAMSMFFKFVKKEF